MLETELGRMKRRQVDGGEIAAFERLLASYEKRKSQFFQQFREIWLGMVQAKFRAGLKAMVLAIAVDRMEPNDFEIKEEKAFQSDLISE